jgi:hypothetical protein
MAGAHRIWPAKENCSEEWGRSCSALRATGEGAGAGDWGGGGGRAGGRDQELHRVDILSVHLLVVEEEAGEALLRREVRVAATRSGRQSVR